MNIGFDAKRLYNNFTGLGNYSRFVVNSLLDYAPENHYFLYSPRIRQHPETNSITSHNSVTVATAPQWMNAVGVSGIWRSWGISKHLKPSGIQVYHGLSQELPFNIPAGIRKIVTVHDLIFLRYPDLYNPIDVKIYTAKVSKACKAADTIIAISQQTADDIVSFLGISASKIRVIYQGCHSQFTRKAAAEDIARVRTDYQLPEKYILNVGTIEKRKNILSAIKAMALLPRSGRMPLVIVGRETPYKNEVIKFVASAGLESAVIFLHHVPFADLPAIYQGAHAFVYPSFFEGFGIPVVESIESGIPVITSRGSCFIEAGGPSTLFVDPSNTEEFAHQLDRIIHDQQLRIKMTVEAKKYATRFAPAAIAKELMIVYRD